MKKERKNSIILLGFLIFILGITAYTSIMTVWDINPNIKESEGIPEAIKNPESPKTSAVYSYNLTVDNNPDSGTTWADVVSEAWCSGSGTAGDPYLISGDTIMFNNSLRGEFACINISNSHDVYFRISSCTVRNNASDYGVGISLSNCTNGAIVSVNASNNGNDGIYLVNSQNITISASEMLYNTYNGLLMDNTNSSTISGSSLNNNYRGGYLTNSTGNLLNACNFTDNSYLGFVADDSNLNNVTQSKIYNNTNFALVLRDSDSCYITSNDIEDNPGFCVMVLENGGDSIGNHFFANDFDNNGANNAFDNGSSNVWDDGVDSGNEWDNYAGADLDDDGIGDTPHPITGDAGSEDRYPIWDDGDSIAPAITIVLPLSLAIYRVPPPFSLTIVEAVGIYNRWYTIDSGAHNTTFTGTTGTITPTDWNRITGGAGQSVAVTITFSVNDTNGNIGTASIEVTKYFTRPSEHGEEEEVYMYSLTKSQIYVLLALSFALSLILRLVTLRIIKNQ